jgi:hypothetical protein
MGFPWLGEANTGTTGVVGEQQSFARHPDGANTWINGDDFALMVPTPGNPNGPSIPEASLPVEFDMETVPPGAIQTYQSFRLFDPVAAGLPASPGGGLAHCAVDTSGGGVISFIGDRDFGGSGNGYRVKGDIFIPASSTLTPIQSIAVGFCGSQGTTFFTNTPSSSGFEDGYWLIYQNRPGAALNNGRADHPATFEFVHATNNGIAPQPVVFLGSATRPSTGAAAESWTSFELLVDPNGLPGEQLVAKVNDSVIFSGAIPAGGPIRGAVQIGFRENHDGGPAASEGTWVDNLSIEPVILPPDPETFDIFSVF